MIARRFELVIFDCDGVLVDSEPIINRAHAEVLMACGYPITEKVLVERFCGMSDRAMLEIIERERAAMIHCLAADALQCLILRTGRRSSCSWPSACFAARSRDPRVRVLAIVG